MYDNVLIFIAISDQNIHYLLVISQKMSMIISYTQHFLQNINHAEQQKVSHLLLFISYSEGYYSFTSASLT